MPDRHAERFSYDWRRSARAEYHLRLLSARTKAVFGSVGADVAILHMNDLPFWEYGAPFVARSLKRIVGRVLLDMDDLPVVAGEGEVRPRVRELAATVDGLLVGNRRILGHLPGRPAWFVPTCIDVAEWEVPDRARSSGPPVLGWVGTPGNMLHLEPLAEVLAEVCRRHGARVRVICSEPPRLPGVPVDFVKWTAEGEVRDILPMDIGLAPLLDGPSERCKCALKALQYMAAGCPVVTSPVGANADVVTDGQDGHHARTPEEWSTALGELLGDPPGRRGMGLHGRSTVERAWSFSVHEATLLDAIRGRNSCESAASARNTRETP